MDRAALIIQLKARGESAREFWCGKDKKAWETSEFPEIVEARILLDAVTALEADAQKEAALKALCEPDDTINPDDYGSETVRMVARAFARGAASVRDRIRAIYGWSNEATVQAAESKE